MRKPVTSNTRRDRWPGFARLPLLAALSKALQELAKHRPDPARAADSRLHCEPLEPRLLLSGDALAAAGLISGAAAGEVQGDELAPADATRVVVDSPADGRGLDWLLTSDGTPLGSFPVFGQSDFVALSVAQDQAPAAEHETHFLDADLNADGRSDRIEIGPRADGIAVARQWLAAGDGFSPGQSSELGVWQADSRYLPGDLDGDGRSDLTVIQAQADGGITADTWLAGDEGLLRAGRSALGRYPAGSEYTLSDTTGDGRADLVVHWLPGDDTRRFTLWRGDGHQFAQTTDYDSYGQGPVPTRPLQLDVNADGLGDLVYLEIDSWEDPLTSDTSTWLASLRGRADGDWDIDYQNFGVWAQTVQVLVGNSEADGRQDLLRLWHDEHGQLQLTPWRSNGYGFTAGESSPLGSPQPEQQFHAADVDGDGRSDVLQIWQDAGGQAQATLWRATPVGDGVRYHESSTASLGVWRDDAQWTLADHNGDHRADLVATWQVADGQQQLAVWLSDGQGFTGQNGWQDDLAWFDADFNADGRQRPARNQPPCRRHRGRPGLAGSRRRLRRRRPQRTRHLARRQPLPDGRPRRRRPQRPDRHPHPSRRRRRRRDLAGQ
jgi:hypothetical protein